jgi:hypothetical protein
MKKAVVLKLIVLLCLLPFRMVNSAIINSPNSINSSAHLIDFENYTEESYGKEQSLHIIDEEFNSVSIRAYRRYEIDRYPDQLVSTGASVRPMWHNAPLDNDIFGGVGYGFAEYELRIDLYYPNNSELREPYDNSMSEVGFGILNNTSPDTYIDVLDQAGQVIETAHSGVDFPIVPSGGHNPIYVGFTYSSNDISSIVVHIGDNGDSFIAIDNISYYRNQEISNIPVPASIWLFVSGIIGLFGIKKKRT